MNTKTLTILVVLAAAAVIAAVLALRSEKPGAGGGGGGGPGSSLTGVASPLPPDLGSKIGGVVAISARSAGGETNVELADGLWRVKEKAGYPADVDKVRGVLVGLASLKNWQEKTSRPELYKSLGVDEPVKKDGEPGAGPQSLLLTLKDPSGQVVTSVIVGNPKPGQSAGSQGVYLRKPADAASYSADGQLDIPREPLMWLNNEFADIGRDRVRSVTVTPREHPEADRIVVTAEKPGAGGFRVEGIPEGRQLKDAALAETVVAGLASAMFEDVNTLEAVDFAGTASPTPGKPGPAVDVRTWDGLLVRVETVQVGDKWWWKLAASADPEPYKEPAAEGQEPQAKRTPEEVNKEVDELNARWAGWAYAPYSYKSAAYTKKLGEELKAPEAAAPASPPAAPVPPPAAPVPAPQP